MPGRPAPGWRMRVGRHALRQFATPVPDRLAGQPRRRRDDRIAAEANRDRFGGGPQPPRPLIEQRPHHHILGDERRFEIGIAPHRTWVRSRFLCSWQANSRVRPKLGLASASPHFAEKRLRQSVRRVRANPEA